MQLRPATIDDLKLILHWDEQPHVIVSDPSEENWEEELQRSPDWREQLIAELDGEPIGFIQIIDPQLEDTHYWGDIGPNKRAIDIWIGEKENLNKGYGTIMMHLAIDRCFKEHKVTSILIDPLKSNVKAHRFYERLGFQFVEERTFDGDECYVYELSRKSWKPI